MSETNVVLPNSKKGHSDRIFIDVVDIMNITGKSQRTAERYMNKIKDYFDKKRHQPITKDELNEYFGVDIQC